MGVGIDLMTKDRDDCKEERKIDEQGRSMGVRHNSKRALK